MSRVQSFDAVVGERPLALVLGSMPGTVSLSAVQYYAHPRNAFWPIVLRYFETPEDVGYEQRLAVVKENGLALWDVLHSCERLGSLDSAIHRKTEQANDVQGLLQHFPSIRTVLLNGTKAAKTYHRVFSQAGFYHRVNAIALPSTSPAYAAMPYREKQAQWHLALRSVFDEN